MTRLKATTKTRRVRQQQRVARLQLDASEVAGRRLLSLAGKSPAESSRMWNAWGWEKIVAAQRTGWEVAWAMMASAFAPWSARSGQRVVAASLRPVERKVRSNRKRLRAG